MFTPRSVLRELFSSFNMEFPDAAFKRLTAEDIVRANVNDTLPPGLDVNEVAMRGKWVSIHKARTGLKFYLGIFSDNGVAVSFFSKPVGMGETNNEYFRRRSLTIIYR
jgi:hypothetical protein